MVNKDLQYPNKLNIQGHLEYGASQLHEYDGLLVGSYKLAVD